MTWLGLLLRSGLPLLFYALAMGFGAELVGELPSLLGGLLWVLLPLLALLLIWLLTPWSLQWLQASRKFCWLGLAGTSLVLALFSYASYPLLASLFGPISVPDFSLPRWSWWLASSLSAPLAEELLFRGYLLQLLQGWMSPGISLLLSALLFAASHGDGVVVLPALVAGLLLGLLYHRAGLLACVLMHGLHNALLLLAWPSVGFGWQLLLAGLALVVLLWVGHRWSRVRGGLG